MAPVLTDVSCAICFASSVVRHFSKRRAGGEDAFALLIPQLDVADFDRGAEVGLDRLLDRRFMRERPCVFR